MFLQECKPAEPLPLSGPFLTHRVNARNGIALASLNADYRLEKLRPLANRGRAVMGDCARAVVIHRARDLVTRAALC